MNQVYKKVKDYALFGLTILCLFLLIVLINKCGDALNKDKYNSIYKKDTLSVIHKTDTIWAKDTVFSFKKIKIPVPQVVKDSFPIYIDTNQCRRIFVYQDSLVDSNLVVYYKDYIQGILRNKSISYKLKVPLRIYDTTIITLNKPPKFALYSGLNYSKGIIAPMIEVGLKRSQIGLGYNLITSSPVFSYKYQIFKK